MRRAATGILRAAKQVQSVQNLSNPVQAIQLWTEKRVLDAFWTRDLKLWLDAEKYSAHTGMLHYARSPTFKIQEKRVQNDELAARLRRAVSPTRVSMKAKDPFRLYLVIQLTPRL